MLMVIFGAGASYDSFATSPPAEGKYIEERPPLAEELFANRPAFAKVLQLFPDCVSIIDDLRHRDAKQPIERVLQRIQDENTDDPVGSREMTAVRYYLQKIIWDCELRWENVHNGVTNYRRLLRYIRLHNKEPEPVCLVTFNYDTMLERAMPAVDVNIKTIEDHVLSPKYKIFKLHGSVNLGRVIARTPFELANTPAAEVPKEIIRHAHYIISNKLLSDEYERIDNPSKGKSTTPGREAALFPALAIPVESKDEFVLPGRQLEELKKYIPNITKLLVIGWRGTDTSFLDLLKNAPREMQVHIVCENEDKAGEVRKQLANGGVAAAAAFRNYTGSTKTRYAGFTGFLWSGAAVQFLES
jgi:hypothetical protein